MARAAAVVEGCASRYFSDITGARVQQSLAAMRDGGNGIGAETSNHYLASIKQLCGWMVREGRATGSPIAHLRGLNARADKRRNRRALTLAETRRVLQATREGPTVRGMAGTDREMLYRVALETGLRWSELRSLTRAGFDLEGNPPTVTVQAAYSKHRRDDTIPLRPGTASALKAYFARMLPAAEAFPMPEGRMGSRLLRVDLESAGIAYVDQSGRVADFHALRHTFITNLADSGVHPSVAQRLARHSDINLTMSRYTHSSLERQSEAVRQLPDIASEPAEMRATGTDGYPVLGSCLAKQSRFDGIDQDESGQPVGESGTPGGTPKPLWNKEKGPPGAVRESGDPTGSRTPVAGSKIRCPRPLDDGATACRAGSLRPAR